MVTPLISSRALAPRSAACMPEVCHAFHMGPTFDFKYDQRHLSSGPDPATKINTSSSEHCYAGYAAQSASIKREWVCVSVCGSGEVMHSCFSTVSPCCEYVGLCVRAYLCVSLCLCVSECVCVSVREYLCECVCVCLNVFVCMCVCFSAHVNCVWVCVYARALWALCVIRAGCIMIVLHSDSLSDTEELLQCGLSQSGPHFTHFISPPGPSEPLTMEFGSPTRFLCNALPVSHLFVSA